MSERDENRSYHFGYFLPYKYKPTLQKASDNIALRSTKLKLESSFPEEKSPKHISTNSYFYDDKGKIAFNPLPVKVAFYSHTYHESAGTAVQESDPKDNFFFDDILNNRHLLPFTKPDRKPKRSEPRVNTAHTSRHSWNREIFVMQDGSIIAENTAPIGFKYIVSINKTQTRTKIQQELQDFLLICTQKLKSSQKFRFAFSKEGKVLHSLLEIPTGQSVIFVGHTRYFQGYHIEHSESTTARSKSPYRSKLSIKSRTIDTVPDSSQEKSRMKSRGKSISNVHHLYAKRMSDAKMWEDSDPLSKTMLISKPKILETDQLEEIIKQHSLPDNTLSEFSPKKMHISMKSHSPDRLRSQSGHTHILEHQNRIIQKVICKIAPKSPDIYKASLNLRTRLAENLVRVDKLYPHMTKNTIKQLENKYRFTRADIHKLYARFKTLLLIAVAVNPEYGKIYLDISNGIDKKTFINGVRGGGTDGIKLISKVFDSIDFNKNGKGYVGFLCWDEFLNAINTFVFSNLEQKIDLFFNAYDPTGFNKVSFQDISELCKLQIKRAAHQDIQDDLSQSFAQFLFDFAGANKEFGMSKNELKAVLNKDTTDMSLIEMFCSFNFLNKFLASKYEDIEFLLLENNH